MATRKFSSCEHGSRSVEGAGEAQARATSPSAVLAQEAGGLEGSVTFREGLGQASRGGDRQRAPARGNFNPKKSPVVHIDKTER